MARASISGLESRFNLSLGPLVEAVRSPDSYRFMSENHTLVSDPVLIYDLTLGDGSQPNCQRVVSTVVREPGPVDGALMWFECELDDGIVLHNRPQTQNHWGQLVCGWAVERGVVAGQKVKLMITLDENEMDIEWLS